MYWQIGLGRILFSKFINFTVDCKRDMVDLHKAKLKYLHEGCMQAKCRRINGTIYPEIFFHRVTPFWVDEFSGSCIMLPWETEKSWVFFQAVVCFITNKKQTHSPVSMKTVGIKHITISLFTDSSSEHSTPKVMFFLLFFLGSLTHL